MATAKKTNTNKKVAKKPATKKPTSKPKSEVKKETKVEVKKEKFRLKKRVIIPVLILLGLFILYFSMSVEETEKEVVINETIEELVNETIVEEPVIEEFKLTELELEFVELINAKKMRYRNGNYTINMALSELADKYLRVYVDRNEDIATAEFGDLVSRAKQTNASIDIRENVYIFEITEENVAEVALSKIFNSHLYTKEMSEIGISVINEGNTYYILLDIY